MKKLVILLTTLCSSHSVLASEVKCTANYQADNDWNNAINAPTQYKVTLVSGVASKVGRLGQERLITLYDAAGRVTLSLTSSASQGSGDVNFSFGIPADGSPASTGVEIGGTTASGEVFDQDLRVTCGKI